MQRVDYINGGFKKTSLEEEYSNLIGSMQHDMVSLWQIIAGGRDDLNLKDEELISFVRGAIVALVRAGAKPSVFRMTNDGVMLPVTRYGSTPEEVAESLIKEWGVFGYVTPVAPGGLWFTAN
jgi:hypothetical protein